ncbi:MAG: DMT family protein [Asticcacaulis sp.]|uniref:DMT family protein n=1 Tax=Asticcacaulis tiandongensis TaxID=2565365 RepID=UPI00112E8EF3|nr:DMT family protein [Asticcacaulis tiandongensis]
MPALHPGLTTVLLLIGSNLFMTYAWYGHLKDKSQKLWVVILISWGVAFFEYCLMVPANRIGYGTFSAAQLKTIQEVITLTIFVGFSALYLGEAIRWTHIVGFCFIATGAAFIFYKG